MNPRLIIKITDLKVYKKTKLQEYQQLIDKFIYLANKIRSNITFIIRQLNKYITNSRKSHLRVTKRVVEYLKRIIYMNLLFGKKLNNCLSKNLLSYNLIGYIENNFTKNLKNRKLIMKYYFFLNRTVISEKSNK